MSQTAPFFVDNEVIRLTQNGVWIADGVEITHEPTRRLFARSLRRDADGGWSLYVGRETKRIDVEDTAYFIHRVDGDAREGFTVWLSDETQEHLKPETLHYRPGRLTCEIKGQNQPPIEAKFLHSAYFDLLKDLEEDGKAYFLVVQGQRITLANK